MAFDAGVLRSVVSEMNKRVSGGKVEKIYQTEKDEIVLITRNFGKEFRILVNAGSSSPRMNITRIKTENPATPPSFCLSLRKHFSGAKLIGISQPGYERIADMSFEAYDEMGFKSEKHIIVELMGKYSNIILSDAEKKILGVLKPVDFSASDIRQLLIGMEYTMPPAQSKNDPTETDEMLFSELLEKSPSDISAEKFILNNFFGISKTTAREIIYRASGKTDAMLFECRESLYEKVRESVDSSNDGGKNPSILKIDGVPSEYSHILLTQYGNTEDVVSYDDINEMIDDYYIKRASEERLRRHAADIYKITGASVSRINKKISLQTEELERCEEGEKYKKYGDLITAYMYLIRKGESEVLLTDWESEGKEVAIPLQTQLTPSQNAQLYYKKYRKAKSARVHLTEQLKYSYEELEYIKSVEDSLTRAETEDDFSQIRDELYHSGYARRMRKYTEKKKKMPAFLEFESSDGHEIIVGKNNLANDYITFKVASKKDWWFHVKNRPGSHVVLRCGEGEEIPSESSMNEAAVIAASFSSAAPGVVTEVDYLKVKEVKKPAGAKPGFVIYHTNRTAFVHPDPKIAKKY